MPIRNSMRLSGATSALRSTIAFWTSMAQFTASTTLRNSTIAPSPVRLTTRPRCTAMVGSIRSLRSARSRARIGPRRLRRAANSRPRRTPRSPRAFGFVHGASAEAKLPVADGTGMAAFPCCIDETRRPGMQARRSTRRSSRAGQLCTTVRRGEQHIEGGQDRGAAVALRFRVSAPWGGQRVAAIQPLGRKRSRAARSQPSL